MRPRCSAPARPLTVEELSTLDQEATLADVRVALEQIREHYDFEQHGVELVEMAGGYQILTRPVHAAAIERAQFSVRTPKLTAAALGDAGRDRLPAAGGAGRDRGDPRRLGGRRAALAAGARADRGRRPERGAGPAAALRHRARCSSSCSGSADLADLPRAEELTIALQPHRPMAEGDDDAAAYVEAES